MGSTMSELKIPTPSPRLRQILEQLAQDPEPLIEEVLSQLQASSQGYQEAPLAVMRDVRDSIAYMQQVWYDVLLSGERPSQITIAAIDAAGRRRVHQGVPLGSLLRAFRLGTKRIWASLIAAAGGDVDLHHELLFEVSPYVFDHFDLMAQTIGRAYQDEQLRRMRWRDALTHELCSILFNRPDNEDGFRKNAAALGLDSSAIHCALSMHLARPDAAPSELEAEAQRLMVSVGRILRLPDDRMLHTIHRGHVLLWLPLNRGETVVTGEQRLASDAANVVLNCKEVQKIGVGLPAIGARGWRASADQALKALETLGRLTSPEPVSRYSDLALNDVVAGVENVTRYFDALIERLILEPPLLPTLEMYFERRQHRKATAAALDIHPNTLNHRLDRIENLLGAQLDDVGWLAKLHTALRLHRSAS